MKTKILKGVLYTLFFLVCLAFFVVRGFPIQLVADKLTSDVEQRYGLRLVTGSLETLFPAGVQASELRLTKQSGDDSPGLVVPVERVKARISLLGLLAGHQDVSFQVELFAGRVDGETRLDGDQRKLKASLVSLDLAKLPIWKDLLGLELAGKLSGEIDLEVSPKDLKATTGTLALTLEQGTLGEGSIKGLSIPKIALGKTQLELALAKGKAEVKTFKVQSDDLEANLTESYLLLQKELIQTNARGKVRFRLTEDFLAKNPKFKDLIQLTGMNQARSDDGFFTYQLFGRIDHLQFRPQRGPSGAGGAGGRNATIAPLASPGSRPGMTAKPDTRPDLGKPGFRPSSKPGTSAPATTRPEPEPRTEPEPEPEPTPEPAPPPEPEPEPTPEPAPETETE
ncbi:MAG TPA: type II secretion system protein GspN [Myxococcota bacterium]|nr:type II secretion system protein GspN [Myxococcota bacterium]HRY94831.1 type II secretion system protein GspN [Myxococcota bacterium]HSA21752.1 type II secretion system protein GspN [Myxococcota bacterium]